MPPKPHPSPRKRNSILVISFLATLLIPAMMAWAVKSEKRKPGIDSFGILQQQDIDLQALSYFQRAAVPDRERPLGLAIFGEDFQPRVVSLSARRGLIYTEAGFVDPKDSRSLELFPSDLRGQPAHPAPPAASNRTTPRRAAGDAGSGPATARYPSLR